LADVKWIKLATQIFDNRKIKQIEKMPEGDAIIVVWFKLLCLAGNVNDGGMVYFTSEMPYTEEMLSVEFNRPIQVIRLALTTFERFGMVRLIDNVLYISSWEKYQNIEGLEKIREQNRIRKQNERERKKLIEESHVNGHVTVTQSHAIDIDIDIEEDIEEDKKRIEKEKKHKYGAYAHVLLKDSELSSLNSQYGEPETHEAIKYLDEYIEMKGYKAKSHYLCIKKWVFDAVKEKKQKINNQANKNKPVDKFVDRCDSREYDFDNMERQLLGME